MAGSKFALVILCAGSLFLSLAVVFVVYWFTPAAKPGPDKSQFEGLVVPLDAMPWGGEMRLFVPVTLQDEEGQDLPTQQLMLDTGSSSVAFCDTELSTQAPAESASLLSCSAGLLRSQQSGYWGYRHRGDLELGNHVHLRNATYSRMQQEVQMPCGQGFGGVFGVAFKQLESTYPGSAGPLQWAEGEQAACPQGVTEVSTVDHGSPLLNDLVGSEGVDLFGIQWSGQHGQSQGHLYLNEAATGVSDYTAGVSVGKAALGEVGFYDVVVEKMLFGDLAFTGFSCDPKTSPCVMDSGNSAIVVPDQVYNNILQAAEEGLPLGALRILLAGVSGGDPVSLQLDVGHLLQNNLLQRGETVVLGLPIWAKYYTVFNIAGGTVEFRVPGGNGKSVPLDAFKWGGGGMRLAVHASPAGAGKQRLVLDTGSSTLAFCVRSLGSEVTAKKSALVSCNKYNPGGAPTGYWGYFYQGNVTLKGGVQMKNAAYSIMEQEANMPCTEGYDGIFGIAFRQLNIAYKADAPLQWPQDGNGTCPTTIKGGIVEPLLQALHDGDKAEMLGIHWSGNEGVQEGRLYVDGDAISNSHYSSGTKVGKASLGELGYYDIDVTQISFAGQSWTDITCDPRTSPCILDTGTPGLGVPKAVAESINELARHGQPLGTLSFQLQGAPGHEPVLLEFDVEELLAKDQIIAMDRLILGLPVWASYYTVLDITGKTVEFVVNQQQATTPEPQDGFRRLTPSVFV